MDRQYPQHPQLTSTPLRLQKPQLLIDSFSDVSPILGLPARETKSLVPVSSSIPVPIWPTSLVPPALLKRTVAGAELIDLKLKINQNVPKTKKLSPRSSSFKTRTSMLPPSEVVMDESDDINGSKKPSDLDIFKDSPSKGSVRIKQWNVPSKTKTSLCLKRKSNVPSVEQNTQEAKGNHCPFVDSDGLSPLELTESQKKKATFITKRKKTNKEHTQKVDTKEKSTVSRRNQKAQLKSQDLENETSCEESLLTSIPIESSEYSDKNSASNRNNNIKLKTQDSGKVVVESIQMSETNLSEAMMKTNKVPMELNKTKVLSMTKRALSELAEHSSKTKENITMPTQSNSHILFPGVTEKECQLVLSNTENSPELKTLVEKSKALDDKYEVLSVISCNESQENIIKTPQKNITYTSRSISGNEDEQMKNNATTMKTTEEINLNSKQQLKIDNNAGQLSQNDNNILPSPGDNNNNNTDQILSRPKRIRTKRVLDMPLEDNFLIHPSKKLGRPNKNSSNKNVESKQNTPDSKNKMKIVKGVDKSEKAKRVSKSKTVACEKVAHVELESDEEVNSPKNPMARTKKAVKRKSEKNDGSSNAKITKTDGNNKEAELLVITNKTNRSKPTRKKVENKNPSDSREQTAVGNTETLNVGGDSSSKLDVFKKAVVKQRAYKSQKDVSEIATNTSKIVAKTDVISSNQGRRSKVIKDVANINAGSETSKTNSKMPTKARKSKIVPIEGLPPNMGSEEEIKTKMPTKARKSKIVPIEGLPPNMGSEEEIKNPASESHKEPTNEHMRKKMKDIHQCMGLELAKVSKPEPGVTLEVTLHKDGYVMIGRYTLQPGAAINRSSTNTAYILVEGKLELRLCTSSRTVTPDDHPSFFIPKHSDFSITNNGSVAASMMFTKFSG